MISLIKGGILKKIKGLWLESLINWGFVSRKDIESGKVTRADLIKRVAQISSRKKDWLLTYLTGLRRC
jgi:hypothetical protein